MGIENRSKEVLLPKMADVLDIWSLEAALVSVLWVNLVGHFYQMLRVTLVGDSYLTFSIHSSESLVCLKRSSL